MSAERSPEQIRASIEHRRGELALSLDRLRGEIVKATDWRTKLAANQQQAMVGAAVAGFVIGGGIAALGSVVFGRRRGR